MVRRLVDMVLRLRAVMGPRLPVVDMARLLVMVLRPASPVTWE